ncbi:MAG: M20 family metallopeptidase, partial [Dehalococcoidia bacterium]
MENIESLAAGAAQEVREEEVVDLARELVRIPSHIGEETPISRYLEAYFRDRGYEVDMQEAEPGRYQAIARLRGKGGGKSLMLNGHVDNEPLPYGYKRAPYTPERDGDILYGFGLANMKAGTAAMIVAAETIRRMGIELSGDIVVCPVMGELQGGTGTEHLLRKGIRADMAIDPEPYGAENVITQHGGMVNIELNTFVNPESTSHGYEIDAFQKMRKI